MVKRIIRKIRARFTKTPTDPFTWTVKDFEAAKRWAKSQPDPENPARSLWDSIPDRDDSSYILAKINKELLKQQV
jgi:hypothetical protein